MYKINFYENDVLIFEDEGEKNTKELDFIYVAYKCKEIINSYFGDYVYQSTFKLRHRNKDIDFDIKINEFALYSLDSLFKYSMEKNIDDIFNYNQANIYINGKDRAISCEACIFHQNKYFRLEVSC